MKEDREFLEELKIERKVFDKRTLFVIFKLMKRGFVKTVESVIKEGKESLVVSARGKNNEWLSMKVYKVECSDFKSIRKYLIDDPRFSRIGRDKWKIIINWCRREFKNLKIAFEAGVSCPEPIISEGNILLTKFIGEDGIPAPRLIDIKIENPNELYEFLIGEMRRLAKSNMVHGDLSAYNIMILDKPYIIDFSQAVTEKHPLAKEFLKRDVNNINFYFKKLKVGVDEKLFDELCEVMGLK